MKNLLSKEALNPRNEEKTGRNRNGSGHTRHGRYGSSCSMTIMTPAMAAGAWCGWTINLSVPMNWTDE